MTSEEERRAKRAAYMREWRKTHPEKRTAEGRAKRRIENRRWSQEWKERNPEKVKETTSRLRARRDPLAHAAQESVRRAIKAGKLQRPDRCDTCGTQCRPEAAHEDYEKPLEVRWLCRPCHRQWDYHEPKGGMQP